MNDSRDASADEAFDRRMEVLIAVGLGLAAILTALCVYLTDVHDDEAQLAFSTGIATVNEANSGYVQAAQKRAADEALFLKFIENDFAATEGDESAAALNAYLEQGVIDEGLKAAIQWWVDGGSKQAPTPFVAINPEYEAPIAVAAESSRAEAEADLAKAQDELQEGDTFIIADIIVATALFLFGIAAVSTVRRLKVAMTALGYGVFLLSLGIVLTNI